MADRMKKRTRTRPGSLIIERILFWSLVLVIVTTLATHHYDVEYPSIIITTQILLIIIVMVTVTLDIIYNIQGSWSSGDDMLRFTIILGGLLFAAMAYSSNMLIIVSISLMFYFYIGFDMIWTFIDKSENKLILHFNDFYTDDMDQELTHNVLCEDSTMLFSLTDGYGIVQEDLDVLFTFSNDKNAKNYVVYTDNTYSDDFEQYVIVNSFNPASEEKRLKSIRTDEEWAFIEEMIAKVDKRH